MESEAPLAREFGEQPIAGIMAASGLRPHDLVAASRTPLTHKMVARACKGRRLTAGAQIKVRDALRLCTGKAHVVSDLFTYAVPRAGTASGRVPKGDD